jgi:thiamine-monophosphate kinase
MQPTAPETEFALIGRLHDRLGAIGQAGIERGIGDDAALWRPSPGFTSVICCDTLIAGRHFPVDTRPADIGWKALAVNLSDLAAMAATPVAALLALSLPALPTSDWIDDFCDGWMALAGLHAVALIGGDTTRGPVLALTVTCIGELPHGTALRRDGARAGDGIYVSGTLGDAAAMLPNWACRDEAWSAPLIARLTRPQPRLALGQALRGLATSAVDISDGFAADISHVLTASGVGARIDAGRLPLSAVLRAAVDPAQALRYALGGGDDYELCFTVPAAHEHALCDIAARTATAITRVGTITTEPGLVLVDAGGHAMQVSTSGWDHFT